MNRRDDWVKRASSRVANGFRNAMLRDGPESVLAPHFDLSRAVDLGARHRQYWLLLPRGSARPVPPVPWEPVFTYVVGGSTEP